MPKPLTKRALARVSLRAGITALTLLCLLVAPGVAADPGIRDRQWYLDTLDVRTAHRISRGEGVVVAVIDSGVEAGHPALTGQVLPGAVFGAEGTDGGRHDRGQNGHGTAMAGLIAGRGGGPNLLLGVAPQAKLLPLALPSESEQWLAHLAEAIRYATDHGAKVINLSLGGAGETPADVVAAVEYALSQDVVVVAAAGNAERTGNKVAAPGNVPGVLTVAGLDRDGQPWSRSGHGPQVAIAAPATDIISTAPPSRFVSGYAITDGTSSATALVSGAAALVRAAHPDLDAANVVNRLVRTAQDVGPPGRDDATGFGVVRPLEAVRAEVPTVPENPLGTPGRSGLFEGDGNPAEGGLWADVEVGPVRMPRVLAASLLVLVPLALLTVVVRVRRARNAAADPHALGRGGPALARARLPARRQRATEPDRDTFGESWVDQPLPNPRENAYPAGSSEWTPVPRQDRESVPAQPTGSTDAVGTGVSPLDGDESSVGAPNSGNETRASQQPTPEGQLPTTGSLDLCDETGETADDISTSASAQGTEDGVSPEPSQHVLPEATSGADTVVLRREPAHPSIKDTVLVDTVSSRRSDVGDSPDGTDRPDEAVREGPEDTSAGAPGQDSDTGRAASDRELEDKPAKSTTATSDTTSTTEDEQGSSPAASDEEPMDGATSSADTVVLRREAKGGRHTSVGDESADESADTVVLRREEQARSADLPTVRL
ncbi:hypothetical protein GCM10012275_42360 [Longimycelium tulufanense]|uniref:Peptidase S8/S53 domain-containing protein n=1 Tax=Longimycelium tulufanense TaxID=907463 RepID=A0A8J3CHH0_9PSEU|nr:S8 family serine peptidase [Longimycelium tulufanense]GGM67305.1 hypothetical protein GCM10012275_42360 [Longimycelium tulufanense]